ncbi:MAG: hypothetical protein Q4G04_01500 [bacterium]|nr:hypothetical protein [bacterium]
MNLKIISTLHDKINSVMYQAIDDSKALRNNGAFYNVKLNISKKIS